MVYGDSEEEPSSRVLPGNYSVEYQVTEHVHCIVVELFEGLDTVLVTTHRSGLDFLWASMEYVWLSFLVTIECNLGMNELIQPRPCKSITCLALLESKWN